MAILNTRLRLKYDTWDNWIRDGFAENFIPLRGEVCVVEVPKTNLEPEITETGAVDSKAHNVEKPAILFKVGDGETSFDKLSWASGLAADVYAWAKKEQAEASDITVKDTKGNFTTVESKDVESILAFLKKEIDAMGGDNGSISEQIADGIAALGEANVSADGKYVTGVKVVDGELVVNEADLPDYSNTYADKTLEQTVADHMTAVADYGTRITTVEALAGNAATKEALEQEVARAKAAEEANAANIKTISDNYVKNEDIANFETKENVLTVANTRYTKEEADAKFALITDAYNDSEVRGLIQNNTDAIAEASEKITTLIGEEEDAGKSVRKIANEELAAQLIAEGAAESLDTLQEIAAWIQAHPGDASAMNSAIQALQAKTVLGTNTEGTEYATVKAYVEAAIAALNIGDYALAANLTALAGRVETLENAGHQNAEEVQTAITTAINDLDSFVEATETTDDGEVSVLTKVVQENGKLTDKSEVKLAKIATNGSIYDVKEVEKDLNGEAEVDCFIFYGGSATELIKNY